ncbi:MAG: AmmeMemoRadiSam system radical SAM enzyme [Clostridiales bacterium]|nr:AmmeMemoRadiSam system radical SAM enzyme [Clostridiales bacterium]
MDVTALYQESLGNGVVRCHLCPHQCVLRPGEEGLCRVRRNVGGVLKAEGYGRMAAVSVEPVEKKPFFHFYPGSWTLSLGTFGCNMTCNYCQNWTISQRGSGEDEPYLGPGDVEAKIRELKVRQPRLRSVVFTFTEPTVSIEYVRDVAEVARREGLSVLLKTNGFLSPQPWEELLPLLDGANIDLKGLRDEYYVRRLGARVGPVMENIARAVEAGIHVEITTLLVPGDFDRMEEVDAIARWIARLDPNLPLHLPRFYPDFQRGGEPSPWDLLEEARNTARQHLHHVYIPSAPLPGATDTFCSHCGTPLLRRRGLRVEPTPDLVEDEGAHRCRRCHTPLFLRGSLSHPVAPSKGL